MSDQTSDTSTELDNGSSEPSMEDILASIRRIIAEDDLGDHGHVDFGDDSAEAADPVELVNISSAVPEDDVLILDSLLDESSDFDIDSSLVIPEPSSQGVDDLEFNPVSNVVSDLEAKLGHDRDTVASSLEVGSGQADGLDDIDLVLTDEFSSEFEALEIDVTTTDTENELDGIRDDILQIFDDSDSDEDLSIDLPISDEISAIDDDAIEILSLDDDMDDERSTDFDIAAESDLDLVKSLMADLTDTSFMDETAETEADSDAEMSLDDMLQEFSDEVEPENAVISDDADGEQDQILTDILDMAIQGGEDQNDFGNLDLTMDDSPSHAEEDSDNPFLQIAAMAEADAAGTEAETLDEIAQLEPSAPKETAEDILNEFDLALLDDSDEALDADVDELSDDISNIEESSEDQDSADMVDFFIEPQEDLTEETEDMAKTARKDTILDEVTETATTDAFASLSQVVEQKAVFTESGPRVGDLVQEALRPMLKEWLDENLKGIVERAVAKEVKRISSGK